MYTYTTKKLPKSTVEILLTIPKKDIADESARAFERLQTELAVEGFRKGKVPKEIAKKNLTKDAVYQETIRTLLGQIYQEILTKEAFKPIISPRIELVKAKENEDWEIKIMLAQKPMIDLGNYKETVKKVKGDSKKGEIWTPGKDQTEKKDPEAEKQLVLNKALEALLAGTKFEISDLVVEAELENRLSLLMEDIQKIGLSVESYLKSKNTTIEEIKTRFTKEINDTLKLEFILAEIAEKENIKVENADLEKLFGNIKDQSERKAAQQNAYMYATILRKQKALEYIIGL